MKNDVFESTLNVTLEVCRSILGVKANEYAVSEDRLHNFKRAAALAGSTPEMALRGMLAKHIISVWDFVDRTEAGEQVPYEKWDEKIIDVINYMILLRAVVLDSGTGGNGKG